MRWCCLEEELMKMNFTAQLYLPLTHTWSCLLSEQQKVLCKTGFLFEVKNTFISIVNKFTRYCPFLKQRRHCFKLNINLRLSIRWEKNLTLNQRASITSFCHRTDNFRLISFSQISHSFLSKKLQSLESLMLIFILILMFICMIHLCNVVSKP